MLRAMAALASKKLFGGVRRLSVSKAPIQVIVVEKHVVALRSQLKRIEEAHFTHIEVPRSLCSSGVSFGASAAHVE